VTLGIVLAEDNLLAREGLRSLLSTEPDLDLLAVCEDYDQLMAAVRMPPTFTDEGVRAANVIRGSHPATGVVVISQYDDPEFALALLDEGSQGRAYLLKERMSDRGQLIGAIRAVADGGSSIDPKIVDSLVRSRSKNSPVASLTPREREVLAEMATGKDNSAVATSLVLTVRAVEKHINGIFSKLGLAEEAEVHKRVKAVLVYLAAD
jgi:DNA-binding NarL/FixJ family response regulator